MSYLEERQYAKADTIGVLSNVLPASFLQLLARYGRVEVAQSADDNRLDGARVLVSTALDTIDATGIARLPQSVDLIANVGIGTDNIDLRAAAARGILVSNTPVGAEDIADLAFALLLACCRRMSFAETTLRQGDWSKPQSQPSTRVHGKTLGIIGFGAIGQAMAYRAAGFAMPVQYWGPRRKLDAEVKTGACWADSLEALLRNSDVVTLHCPLMPETRHLIDARTLALFKPGAVLINTGRGALVDEAALAVALRQGRLRGAGLDVFEFEPRITPELLELENVVLTPHIGSATGECRREMAQRVAANISYFLANGRPLDPVT